MCHFCGAGLTMSNESKKIQENGNSMKLNGRDPVWSCKFCGEKQEKESIKHNGLGPYGTPLISPTSLTSSSTALSCSAFPVDVYSHGRGYQEDASADSSQEDLNFRSNECLQNLSLPMNINRINRTNVGGRDHVKESGSVNNSCTGKDAETIRTCDGQETRDNTSESTSVSMNEETESSYSLKDEIDAQIWVPPEPEDQEDDREGSVVNYDDDDEECGDDMTWGKSSCLSCFGEEGSGSYRFKEEKQKAMEEVMNGKFKALVGQLLKSVGVACSGEDGDSWGDVVTSLSWEAASFVKPDAIEGKAMDPDGYVKVKCIATGSRSQSQVIRGLVFKKHAAHKHMPTKYKNPRLLLIRGTLGSSSSELSSFESMQQEKQSLKSIIEMIELCQPNVVLVENNVSRDIQESILAKGMTLVFDMKLHRLERVARCTHSPILSPDILMGQKLKQCDSFHFEKFLEEHNASSEVGKTPSKTLMFIEGCPTRLGCTILLKGAHSEELKRIKCVLQCAVVMAYHLILETSFLLDQRAMFSTIPFNGVASVSLLDQQSPSAQSSNSKLSSLKVPSVKPDSSCTADIPISNGFHEEGSYNINSELEGNSEFSYEPYNPVILSGLSSLSASLKKVIGDSFPLFSSASCQSMSTYFEGNGRVPDNQIPAGIHVSTSPKAFDHCNVDTKARPDEEKALYCEQSTSYCEAPPDTQKCGGNNEGGMQRRDDISTVMDSESILVLMSSQNASRGTICEQSHFSHIKFYRNFDVPLGKFLQDNLLNQRLQCATCSEPPDAHLYYYAHHNKQLKIQVKHLPGNNRLPGQVEGKLWMWSRCGKCKSYNGNSKSTKRVVISTAALGLSFGKFLELSFSNQSLFSRPSICGHSFHKDFHYFFGLGTMVAMLRYSPVITYSVALASQKLEFSNSIKGELLRHGIEKVYSKGIHLFEDVAKLLQKIESRFEGSSLKLGGSIKEFSDIVKMLKAERSQFEVNIQKAVLRSGNPDEAVYKLLSLNRFLCDILLESCVWDQRINSLLSIVSGVINTRTTGKIMQGEMQGETYLEDGSAADRAVCIFDGVNEVLDNSVDMNNIWGTPVESKEFSIKEIPIEGSRVGDESSTSSIVAAGIERPTVGSTNVNGSSGLPVCFCNADENCQKDNLPLHAGLQVDRSIPNATDIRDGVCDLNVSERGASPSQPNYGNLKTWVWAPFPEIRREYMNVLQRGYLPKLESIYSDTVESIPRAHELITEEGSRMHIPLGTDDYIVSDYEDEFSSIIACALALLKDLPAPTEVLNEDARRDRVTAAKMYESSQSLSRMSSLASPHWSSIGSFGSNGIHSTPSSKESHLSSFDGLNLLDSLVFLQALHPEVSMGNGKLPGKGKYTVTCVYASQFRDLRNQCCPSELDYIASLSRCRNWDAKGGKSKSFFAKTLDDRFIIKEIKKTEFESFGKFAPDYFRYMNECFELRNQTCLAKILGIYQVTIGQTKSGKEIKHDLMVMENLSFGRNSTRQYDLKGALHARFNSATDGSGDVLLDQNFVNDMNASPLYVSTKSKRHLQRAVWNDTTFLNSINVMDYSLLVGVDTHRRELVCGIIDYLRQYTWDKQLETWVKSSLVVPKNHLPTIISPREYKKRFRKFITTYFLSVPDRWCSQRSSNPCKLCGMSEDDSSDTKSHEQGKQNGSST